MLHRRAILTHRWRRFRRRRRAIRWARTRRAVGLSDFGKLPPELLARVLEGHRDVSVELGHRFMGRDQPAPHRTGLVVSGLPRMYIRSPDGRQITFRYAGPGYFLGAIATVGGLNVQDTLPCTGRY